MNPKIEKKLEQLNSNYKTVTGCHFSHFFCPILFRDEDVNLCEGHIINRAFPNSSRSWIIQRQDVDSFFGSRFEAEFISILYKQNGFSSQLFTNKKLHRRYKPEILHDDKPIDYFITKHPIPNQSTILNVDGNGSKKTVIKMPPHEVSSLDKDKWETKVEIDVRIQALATLIKSAHLTLFELLGYRYALSNGGNFVGKEILGNFYEKHKNEIKQDILIPAKQHFFKFENLVRPVASNALNFQGTITDRKISLCCLEDGKPWAFIIYVKTDSLLHAVMIPILDNEIARKKFNRVLCGEDKSVQLCTCIIEKDQYKITSQLLNSGWNPEEIKNQNC